MLRLLRWFKLRKLRREWDWYYRILWIEPPEPNQTIAVYQTYKEAVDMAKAIAAVIRPDIPSDLSGVKIGYDHCTRRICPHTLQEIDYPDWRRQITGGR